jgi:hypothetical protein
MFEEGLGRLLICFFGLMLDNIYQLFELLFLLINIFLYLIFGKILMDTFGIVKFSMNQR